MTCEEARRILLSDFHVGEEPSAMAMVKAVEALEKQIPKKPVEGKKYEFFAEYSCPCCGCIFFEDETLPYCLSCGQALDWSEEKLKETTT